jgi:hypothetical protein
VFRTRASKVLKVLEAAGVKAAVNPEKPRKGAFVVTVGGKKVIELLNMPRPFTKLREIDVDEVVSAALKK